MPTGSDLKQDVADLVPTYDNTDSNQQTRVLRHADIVQRQIVAEIVGINPRWRMEDTTFTTNADTSPNQYTIGSGQDITITDFMGVQHMYRVIDDSKGDYDEIWHLDQVRDQHDIGDGAEIRGLLTGSSGSKGPPKYYLVNVDQIQLFPISDDTYTIRLFYTKSPADLTDSGTITVPYVLYNALVYGTAREEMAFRKEAEWREMEAMYQSALQSGLSTMVHQVESPRFVSYIRDHAGEYV